MVSFYKIHISIKNMFWGNVYANLSVTHSMTIVGKTLTLLSACCDEHSHKGLYAILLKLFFAHIHRDWLVTQLNSDTVKAQPQTKV